MASAEEMKSNDKYVPPPSYAEATSNLDTHFGNASFHSSLPPATYFSPEQMQSVFGPPPRYSTAGPPPPTGYADSSAPYHPPPVNALEPVPFEKVQTIANMQGLAPQNPGEIHVSTSNEGVVSNDSRLDDPATLLGFFYQYNTRPGLFVRVRGHHIEHRTRTVSSGSGKNRHTHTEHYTEDVTDFDYSIDASQYVYPFGYIQALPAKDGTPRQVDEILQEYVKSDNKLKMLKMYKDVAWDYSRLTDRICSHIRSQGWHRLLDVEYEQKHYKVEARSPSRLSACWNHPLTQCFCCITCLCIIFWPIALCYRKEMDGALRSHFQMNIDVEQFFLMNQHLFVPDGHDAAAIVNIEPVLPEGTSLIMCGGCNKPMAVAIGTPPGQLLACPTCGTQCQMPIPITA